MPLVYANDVDIYNNGIGCSVPRYATLHCDGRKVHLLNWMRLSRKEPTIGFRLLYYALILAIAGAFTAWFYLASSFE